MVPRIDFISSKENPYSEKEPTAAFKPDRKIPTNHVELQTLCRNYIRLLQCPQCSHIMTKPVTLACGHTFCHDCLPYPVRLPKYRKPTPKTWTIQDPTVTMVHVCPFSQCGMGNPTPINTVSTNVLMSKAIDVSHEYLWPAGPDGNPETSTTAYVTVMKSQSSKNNFDSERVAQQIVNYLHQVIDSATSSKTGSTSYFLLEGEPWLACLFRLAKNGKLPISSETCFHQTNKEIYDSFRANVDLEEKCRTRLMDELVCYICFGLVYRPTTTQCGHTFCKECLQRNVDHSSPCPVCRKALVVYNPFGKHSENVRLCDIVNSLFPQEITVQRDLARQEYHNGEVDGEIPLFCCSSAFPASPTFFHIYEPKYKLMMRRVFNGNRQFALVSLAENHHCRFGEHAAISIGDFGNDQRRLNGKQYMEVGTICEVQDRGWLVDGRSYLECLGLRRIRVLDTFTYDGYLISKIENYEDISQEKEDEIERTELAAKDWVNHSDLDGFGSSMFQVQVERAFGYKHWAKLHRMSNSQLIDKITNFGHNWPAQGVYYYGDAECAENMPTKQPWMLPYWLFYSAASSPDEKYAVLRSRCLRDRLKLAAIKVDMMVLRTSRRAAIFRLVTRLPVKAKGLLGIACLAAAFTFVRSR